MPLVQGELLHKRYRILEVLGHGGMGSVYRAHDENLSVDVAVKENLFTTEDYARQFRLEATILASLRHPNLPRVSDHFVLSDEGQYLVMDYIEGPDLRQILEKNGPITEEEAIRIGAAICDALTYLHSRTPAILHRDIKLGNIKLVKDGHISLVDFGLAKIIEGDQPTMTGARAMTPGYSPPEQYGSSRTDARSDIYSLGATLYAALTGFIPEDSLARAIDGLPLTPLRKRSPKISARVAAVIEKAMETTPTNRYQSAREFKEALQGNTPISQPQVFPTTNTETPSQPNVEPITGKPPSKPTRPALLRLFIFLSMIIILGLTGLFYTNPGILPLQASGLLSPTTAVAQANSPLLAVVLSPTAEATAAIAASTANSTSTATSTSSPTATTRPPTPTERPSATALPISLETPTDSGNGKIAFASTREGISQIYIMNVDGSQQEQLFTQDDGACQPRWSPDGKKLAFTSPCRGRQTEYPNARIMIYDLDSRDITILRSKDEIETTKVPSEIAGDFDPAWSPDGRFIVFTSVRDSTRENPHSQIYKIDIKTKDVTRLVKTGFTQPARQPIWSPDGKTILYNMRRFGLWQLWIMNPDGSNPIQLVRSGENISDFQPTWSPDGASIYFSQTGIDQTTPARLMWLVIGQEIAQQLTVAHPLRDVSLSPDGQWLVAEGTNGDNIDIYRLSLTDNGNITLLTTDPAVDFDPQWKP